MTTINVTYKNYLITTDRSLMQPEAIHRWLTTESYWSKGIPYETVKKSFDHSFVAGILHEDEQVGYGRLVTDYATFAYLADVYVAEPHRGIGLSKQLMQVILSPDWVKNLRRILLTTMDAHGLYAQFGFIPFPFPERLMTINKVNAYHPTTGTSSTEEQTK